MLVPVLVYAFGPKEAVPIMAVAAIMANISRVLAWWRDVDWRACAAYAVPGIPAGALGAKTLLILPSGIVDIAIGLFLILMIPVRRWFASRRIKLSLLHLAMAGTTIGFLTGIVVTTGPITVPIFIAYGLVKGAFLATEAMSSLGVYAGKALAFQQLGALPLSIALKGLFTGSSIMAGTFVAKRYMYRLTPQTFHYMMDVLMLVSGLSMFWNAA